MNSPYSRYARHARGYANNARNGEAREWLTATLLGLALMATMTTWWWDAMR